MYRGAVFGSNGLMMFASTASLINLEILPEEDSFNPNLFLNELLVTVLLEHA